MQIKRNAFGSQLDSFVGPIDIPCLQGEPFPGIFIRAPVIEKVLSEQVQVLGVLDTPTSSYTVAVQQNNLLGTAFHP